MDGAGIADKAMWVPCMGLSAFPQLQPRTCLFLGFEDVAMNCKLSLLPILYLLKNTV